jgi:hypothetical protein
MLTLLGWLPRDDFSSRNFMARLQAGGSTILSGFGPPPRCLCREWRHLLGFT